MLDRDRMDGIGSVAGPGTLASDAMGPSGTSVAGELMRHALYSGRVAFGLISDSNGLSQDNGLLGGMCIAMRAGLPCFGTGIWPALGTRNKYSHSGGGGWTSLYPRYNWSIPTNGVRNGLPVGSGAASALTNVAWDDALGTLTLGASIPTALSTYTFNAGDTISVTMAYNASNVAITAPRGDYPISAFNGTNMLTIAAGSFGTSTAYVSLNVNPGNTSASSLAGISQAYAAQWNMPISWIPFGGATYHVASGSQWISANMMVASKDGVLPVNGNVAVSVIGFAETGGTLGNASIYEFDGTTLTNQFAVAAHAGSGAAGTFQVVRATSTPADRISGNTREYVCFGSNMSAQITGPASMFCSHACNASMPFGVSLSPFIMRGGHSTWDVANVLAFATDATIRNYLAALADQCAVACGGTGVRRVCLIVNGGFNDDQDARLDKGGNGLASYTPDGYYYNLKAVVTRLRAMWDSQYGAGASDSELYFMFVPSHPISDTPSAAPASPPSTANDRQGLRALQVGAAQRLAAIYPGCFCIDLFAALGATPYTKLYNCGFTPGTDHIHLAPAGYSLVAQAIVNCMRSAGP